MANPAKSAVYSFVAGGALKTLTLNFDAQWNIVNSTINSNPISGSYDPTTGEITFLEHIVSSHPIFGIFPPYYVGYVIQWIFDTPAPKTMFAGLVDQTVLVHSGTWPNIILQYERIENGWRAIQQ